MKRISLATLLFLLVFSIAAHAMSPACVAPNGNLQIVREVPRGTLHKNALFLRYLADFIVRQPVVDLVPIYDRVNRKLIEARATEIRFNRKVNRTLREPLETDRERAQRLYIGERAMINRRTRVRSGLLRR